MLEEYEGSGEDRRLVGHVKKYKVTEKTSAIDKLMKHLGLFEKDNEQKANPVRDLLQAIGARSALPVVAKPEDGDA